MIFHKHSNNNNRSVSVAAFVGRCQLSSWVFRVKKSFANSKYSVSKALSEWKCTKFGTPSSRLHTRVRTKTRMLPDDDAPPSSHGRSIPKRKMPIPQSYANFCDDGNFSFSQAKAVVRNSPRRHHHCRHMYTTASDLSYRIRSSSSSTKNGATMPNKGTRLDLPVLVPL